MHSVPCCFISFNSEIVSKAFDCFGNRSCSDKVAVGRAGCLELSLCFTLCSYRVILRQCLRSSHTFIVQALNLEKPQMDQFVRSTTLMLPLVLGASVYILLQYILPCFEWAWFLLYPSKGGHVFFCCFSSNPFCPVFLFRKTVKPHHRTSISSGFRSSQFWCSWIRIYYGFSYCFISSLI